MGEKRRSDIKGPKWKKLKQESGKLVLGSRGVLITNSLSGKYKEAMQEALSILRQHCEDFYPSEANGDQNGPTVGMDEQDDHHAHNVRPAHSGDVGTNDHYDGQDVHSILAHSGTADQDELAREREELKRYFNRFTPGPCISKGLNFVYFQNENDVPSKYVQEIFMEIKRNKSYSARYLSRIVPVDYVCNATFATLEEALRKLVSKEFPASTRHHNGDQNAKHDAHYGDSMDHSGMDGVEEEGGSASPETFTWALEYKSTNSNALKRQDVLDLVVAMIGRNYKVELKKPDKLVVIQVVKGLCGLSVITNYSEIAHFKLNISIPRD